MVITGYMLFKIMQLPPMRLILTSLIKKNLLSALRSKFKVAKKLVNDLTNSMLLTETWCIVSSFLTDLLSYVYGFDYWLFCWLGSKYFSSRDVGLRAWIWLPTKKYGKSLFIGLCKVWNIDLIINPKSLITPLFLGKNLPISKYDC